MTTAELKEEILDFYENVSFLDEHEDKLVGYAESCAMNTMLLYLGVNFFLTKNPIKDIYKYNKKALYATGHEKSVIGYFKNENGKYLLVHDKLALLNEIEKEGMTFDDAMEYYEYNIVGGYIENGPIYGTINWSNILIKK